MQTTFGQRAHGAESTDRPQHSEQLERILNSPAHQEAAAGLQDKGWAHGGLKTMMNLEPSEALMQQHKMGNGDHMMAQSGPGGSQVGRDGLRHGQHSSRDGADSGTEGTGKHTAHGTGHGDAPKEHHGHGAGRDDAEKEHHGHGTGRDHEQREHHGHGAGRNAPQVGQDVSQLPGKNPGALSVDQLTSLAASNPGMVAAMGATPDVIAVAQGNPALQDILIRQNPALEGTFGVQAGTDTV